MTFLRASNYTFFLEGWTIVCKHASWHPHKIGFQLLEFLFVQNPEFLWKSSFGIKSIRFYWLQAKYKERWKTPDTKERQSCKTENTQDTQLFSFNARIIHYAFGWISFTLAWTLLTLLHGYGEADPLIKQPWFIHFHCTRMTLGVQICFFPHMRNDIVSRPMLNCKLISLPYPNQFVLFVNLTITKIQRSITQRLLISLFYFVPLIDTLQSSGLKQHNGSLETLSASQLGSWHLVTTPGCLFFSFQSKTAGEYLSVYWWHRTCSRTGRDSCCRSSYKILALSTEAWQINKTKCKICFCSVGQKLHIFQKAQGLFRCFLPHYVHVLHDWTKSSS